MPVPTPGPDEEQGAFISRCISLLTKEDPNRPSAQIQAMCYNAWRTKEGMEARLHPDFKRILRLFIVRYGEHEGIEQFETFVNLNKLNPGLAYSPRVQFTEDFQWVTPLISMYSKDKSAKYYLIRCLTANISMNNRDYSDYKTMVQAAPSLSYRPVNIDHDYSAWLPYPRTRMDFTIADNMSVEGTLRVDNADELLQKMLDHDPDIPEDEWIVHPSIEGRPNPGGKTPRDGYHFTGLALLRKGYTLPGDPLTEIQPLMLNESIMKSFRESFSLEDGVDLGDKKLEEERNPIQCNQCGWTVNRPLLPPEKIKNCPFCNSENSLETIEPLDKDITDNFTNNESMIDIVLSAFESIPEEAEWEEIAEFKPKADWPDSCFAYVPGGPPTARKFPYRTPEGKVSIPNVRNALARLAQANIPEKEKNRIRKLMQNLLKHENPDYEPSEDVDLDELFRPPHGGTALSGDPQAVSSKFKKVSVDYGDIPQVGVVQGTKIGLVEALQKVAELTEENLELTKKIETSTAELRVKDETIAELHDTIANKDRLLGTGEEIKAEAAQMLEKLSKTRADLKEYKAKLKSEREAHDRTKARITIFEGEVSKLETDVEAAKARHTKVVEEMTTAIGNASKATAKSIEETKQRAILQEEVADLREKVAGLTRALSECATSRSLEAKKLMEQEERIAELLGQITKLEGVVKDLNADKKAVQRRVRYLDKLIKDQGFVEMDKKGNIKI